MKNLPQRLVIDANILFSFFKSDSTRRNIIEKLIEMDVKLISPSFILEELKKEKEKIRKFAKISENEFKFLFDIIKQLIEECPEESYKEKLKEANKISPHNEDKKDDPYFALAITLNCPIWSDEIDFKKQSRIEINNTKELLDLLSKE